MERRSLSDSILLLLVIAIASALLLPALFMDGMFMDGTLYTCVGKNLAAGRGTFWNPYFSATYLTSFHEQPPLMFALEAGFFRVLGNSLYTERLYCLFMCISAFFALRMLWRTIFPEGNKERKLFWLAALMFFTSPVTFYAYTNNVEEATMVVFALVSSAFILRGLHKERHSIIWYVIGGIALIASSLCKGFQGLFPLVVPMVWWLCVRNITFRKAFVASAIVCGLPLMFYFLISFYQPAYDSYAAYFQSRFYTAFSVDSAATTSNRSFILYELLLDLLPALAIAVVLIFVARKQKFILIRETLALFLIGMSGILPLMVTLEQRGFYLVTALPFVTTAIALMCVHGANKVTNALGQRRRLRLSILTSAILILAGAFIATIYLTGKPKRDVVMLHDVRLIGEKCGKNSIVSTDESTFQVWSLQCYLVRYHDIAVSNSDTTSTFFIVPHGKAAPAGYEKVDIGTEQFHVYSK